MSSAQRKRYLEIVKSLAGDDLTQDQRDIIGNIPDWFMPIWIRSGIRLLNQVPHGEVERLALREIELAQAKRLAGEA